jgi:site-specific recombinase XerD
MTLYDVKEALGHSSIVTTQRYAHLAPQRLMQAACEAQAHYKLEMLHISGPAE